MFWDLWFGSSAGVCFALLWGFCWICEKIWTFLSCSTHIFKKWLCLDNILEGVSAPCWSSTPEFGLN